LTPPAGTEGHGLILTVDLDGLKRNYHKLCARFTGRQVGACVKAGAYGIGLEKAVPALAAAGCRTFFVALPHEGVAARQALRAAGIADDVTQVHVLDGFFPRASQLYRTFRLRPVLGTPEEIARWTAWREDENATLHVDTGMNRLGIRWDRIDELFPASLAKDAGIDLVMSHFACADTPDHPLNEAQIDRFAGVRAAFPGLAGSLCNSAGIFLSDNAHHDLARPGISLYGGASHPDAKIEPVVKAEARILAVRPVKAGENVGYGGTWTAQRETTLAILAAGYADGYLRAAGTSDGKSDGKTGAEVSIAGHRAPVVGRVSMDLIATDITDIPVATLEAEGRDICAELFGPAIDINQVAEAAGTIAYELLTNLSRRAARLYIGETEKN
jgi:alanine racemase